MFFQVKNGDYGVSNNCLQVFLVDFFVEEALYLPIIAKVYYERKIQLTFALIGII